MSFMIFMQRKMNFIQWHAQEIYNREDNPELTSPVTTIEQIGNEYKLTLISHLTINGQASPYILTDTGQSSFLTQVQTLINWLLAELYE